MKIKKDTKYDYKTSLLLIFLIATATTVGFFQVSHADLVPDIIVFGTGDPAIDVPAVQDAVNNFEVVQLVGTFDFGEPMDPVNFVGLYSDVMIFGEIVKGKHTTKIEGGLAPFRVYSTPDTDGPTYPETGLYYANPIHVTIQDIWFDQPVMTSIAMYTGGATIINNKITDVQQANVGPGFAPMQAYGIQAWGFGYVQAAPFIPYPSLTSQDTPGYYNDGTMGLPPPFVAQADYIAIYDDILLHNNVVDGAYADHVKGFWVQSISDAITVTITHNTIMNLQTSPIFEGPFLMDIRNFLHPDSMRRIEYNYVSSPIAHIPLDPWGNTFDGIYGIDVSGGGGNAGEAYIKYNTIISEGTPVTSLGWWHRAIFHRGYPTELTGEVIGNTIIGHWGSGIRLRIVEDCLVKNNDLSQSHTAWAQLSLELQGDMPVHDCIIKENRFGDSAQYGIFCLGHNNLISENEFRGTYDVGIQLVAANDNTIKENSIKGCATWGIAVTAGSSTNVVSENTVRKSGAYDLYWDETGSGNVWNENKYKTASPSELD
jgi:parallel beta-helix repeat protein